MDLTSISPSRYTDRAFNPIQYEQSQNVGYPGGGAGGPSALGDTRGVGPLPGSNRLVDSAVWLSERKEVASLDRIHVSEVGQNMLSRAEGLWEVQSWTVRLLQDTQNSLERQTAASQFMTRSAINTLMSLERRIDLAGSAVDIYA
jgi:hypothetical protein